MDASNASIDFITPDNVAMLVSVVTATIGIATTTIKAVQLWVDARKSRKIKIKYETIELELQGDISNEEIKEKLEIFNDFQESIYLHKLQVPAIEDDKLVNSSDKLNINDLNDIKRKHLEGNF